MSLLKLLFCEKYFNTVIDRIRSKRKVKFASSKVQPKKTKTRNTNVGSFGATCLLQFSKVYYRGISRPSLVKCYGLSPRPPQYPHPPSKHPPPITVNAIYDNLETSQPRLIHQIIILHRTDTFEIVKGLWP